MAEALSERQRVGANVTQASYLEFLDRYEDADNVCAAATASRKDLRAAIKAAGIPLASFDRTRRDSKKSGDVREHEEGWYRRMMGWRNKPVGFQASMDLPDDGDAGLKALNVHELKTIDNEGFNSGKASHRRDSNSYTPGTEAYTRWDNAWLRGQAEIAEGLAKTPAAAAAAKAAGANGGRRGRPRGSGKNQRAAAAAAEGKGADEQPVH